MEEKVYTLPQNILDALYKNETPEIKKKEMDVYLAADMLHKCLRDHFDDEIVSEEMLAMINELEEENPEINPFKLAAELQLNQMERLILYYAVTKTTIGEEIIDVDRMMSNFFNSQMERAVVRRLISKRQGKLFESNLLEFINEDFKTDKQLKLSADAVKLIFGEDACFLSEDEDYSSGLCKLIKCDAIVEKELFYNENEQQSINTVSEFLKNEKFSEIVKRLEENKMRPGLTILLHGYPGTGKTETIYQLARQTNRNILLVDISEIRDKYVGESEKRLKAVFETYKNSIKHFEQVPILLFNESDALIGKRINVNNSVDQMNNAMQNILLQELEDFRGILMATTNLTSNLDEAFERRFLFKIKYAKPSMVAKKSIWKSKLTFLSDEDAKQLAEEFDFSGGQIENISRKIFLDSVLHGKSFSIKDTMQYCEEEDLLNKNKARQIGF
ncbi:MAG: AAA family ATPase [Bacteroidetes bacterium]|nr:AAA family ATPase [Bacteroidota bacterium]